jgi:hypothetical protein
MKIVYILLAVALASGVAVAEPLTLASCTDRTGRQVALLEVHTAPDRSMITGLALILPDRVIASESIQLQTVLSVGSVTPGGYHFSFDHGSSLSLWSNGELLPRRATAGSLAYLIAGQLTTIDRCLIDHAAADAIDSLRVLPRIPG